MATRRGLDVGFESPVLPQELKAENLKAHAEKMRVLQQELDDLRGLSPQNGVKDPEPPPNIMSMYFTILEALDETEKIYSILFNRFGEFTREEESGPLPIESDALIGASSFRYKMDNILCAIRSHNNRVSHFLTRIDIP